MVSILQNTQPTKHKQWNIDYFHWNMTFKLLSSDPRHRVYLWIEVSRIILATYTHGTCLANPPPSNFSFTLFWLLWWLHTMAKGQEAVYFHQSHCKKPKIRPLRTFHTKDQSPKAVASKMQYFSTLVLTKATHSCREFELDTNENPNYNQDVVNLFH